MAAPPLDIQLVVTAKGRELAAAWAQAGGQTLQVEPVAVAQRGVVLSAVVFFSGCKPNALGDCDVEMDIVAHAPHGAVYGEMKGAELWQRKPAPAPGATLLGVNYMAIVIEPQDAAGVYRLTATARDRVGKTEARSSASFEVR